MLIFVEDQNGHIIKAVQVVDDEDGEMDNGMTIDTVIQWLKIQKQNRKDFPEVGNDKKIESLDTAISYLDDLQEVKKVVAKWKTDNFTDGYAWDCMKEIADIVDKAESEDKDA